MTNIGDFRDISPGVGVFFERATMNLYPHQRAALAAVKSFIKSDRRAGLIGMPTGTGKTVMSCTMGHESEQTTMIDPEVDSEAIG